LALTELPISASVYFCAFWSFIDASSALARASNSAAVKSEIAVASRVDMSASASRGVYAFMPTIRTNQFDVEGVGQIRNPLSPSTSQSSTGSPDWEEPPPGAMQDSLIP
jgi:hypothetical protein